MCFQVKFLFGVFCFFLAALVEVVFCPIEEKMSVVANGGRHEYENTSDHNYVLDIYPLSSYYFGSKKPIPFKDQTLDDRIQRMKSNYAAHGLRTCMEAVILDLTRGKDALIPMFDSNKRDALVQKQ